MHKLAAILRPRVESHWSPDEDVEASRRLERNHQIAREARAVGIIVDAMRYRRKDSDHGAELR